MNRNLNYEHVFNTVTESLANYVTKCHLETCILGISGGIDSTVVAAIAHKVSERTGVKLIGVSLMCNTNENDEITTNKHHRILILQRKHSGSVRSNVKVLY